MFSFLSVWFMEGWGNETISNKLWVFLKILNRKKLPCSRTGHVCCCSVKIAEIAATPALFTSSFLLVSVLLVQWTFEEEEEKEGETKEPTERRAVTRIQAGLMWVTSHETFVKIIQPQYTNLRVFHLWPETPPRGWCLAPLCWLELKFYWFNWLHLDPGLHLGSVQPVYSLFSFGCTGKCNNPLTSCARSKRVFYGN